MNLRKREGTFLHRIQPLLDGVGLKRSTFYRRTTSCGQAPKKRGRPLQFRTPCGDGSAKSTPEVIGIIEEIISEEFAVYGCDKVQNKLRRRGIVIGRKKTYRLMKDHSLLHSERTLSSNDRSFIRVRRVKAQRPFEHLQMDIKQIYLYGEDRLAYVLTLEDTFSRAMLAQAVKYSIQADHSVVFLHQAQVVWKNATAATTLRTDNGAPFIAHRVRDYVTTQEQRLIHEFCHKATPQENGFIESFHSIVEAEVVRHYEFRSLDDAQQVFQRHTDFYNRRRLHGRLGYKAPMEVLQEYWQAHPLEKPTQLPPNLVPLFGG